MFRIARISNSVSELQLNYTGHTGMNAQISLIEKAKRDGVKRFVPSEFGVDHRTVKSDFFKPKMKVFEAVEKAAFPDGTDKYPLYLPVHTATFLLRPN